MTIPRIPIRVKSLRGVVALLALLLAPNAALAQTDSTFAPCLAEARQLVDQAHYAASDSVARACLEQVIRAHGPGSLDAADFMVQIVLTAWRAGKDRDPAIRALADQALAIREKKLPPNDVGIAGALRAMGFVVMHTQGSAAAIPIFRRALEIRKAAQGTENTDYASALIDLGVPYMDTDRHEFRVLNEEAAGILERLAPDGKQRGAVLTNLGAAALDEGDYAKALQFSEEAVRVKLKAWGPEHPRTLVSLANVAEVRRTLGDYAGALDLLEQVKRSQTKALGPWHPELIVTLQNIAELRQSMGDYPAAREDYERAVAISDSSLAHVSVPSVEGRLGLAETLIHLDESEKARALILQAMSIDSRLDSTGTRRQATALNHLGSLESHRGNSREASGLYDRALVIQKRLLEPGDIELARTRVSLARALLETGDLARARSLLSDAESSLKKSGLENTMVRVECLAGQSALEHLSGDDKAAVARGLEAEAASRAQLRLTAEALSERAALTYATNRPSTLPLLVLLAARESGTQPDLAGRVWDSLIQSRAMVLDEMAERTQALALTEDPEVEGQKEKLTAARSRMANLMLTGPGGARPDHYVALLEETRREAEGLESALAAKSRRLRDVRDRRTLGLSQVTASLSPGDALVAFARYEFRDQRGYTAFVLTPGRPPVAIDLGEGARIDDLVSAWYALASRDPAESASSESACDAAAHALSDGIWSPIVPSLFEATRIFVVPDGTLNEVNFAALPGKSGYLVEDGIAVEYLSAERDLAAPVSDVHGQGLLAMGGIDYAKSEDSPEPAADGATAGNPVRPTLFRGRLSDCTAIRNIRFVPLPGSKKELDDLTQLWRGSGRPASLSRVIIGKAATESALKKAAAGRSILHLATHAFVEGECGGAGTRGVGGMETVAEGTTQSAVTDNPFRVCGLAFAGANVRNSKPPDDDDGVLTAEEVTSLDLSGVDWAVLSACDTGRGEVVSGEGLLGLRRAFQVAGARTLITSLWPVGDESTRGWMDRLYRARLGRHETTIDAVRSADLDMLKDRRARHESIHPFYWAGFVASGDWR